MIKNIITPMVNWFYIVEINNLISIKSVFSVGSYNLKNIKSPICLTVGEEAKKLLIKYADASNIYVIMVN